MALSISGRASGLWRSSVHRRAIHCKVFPRPISSAMMQPYDPDMRLPVTHSHKNFTPSREEKKNIHSIVYRSKLLNRFPYSSEEVRESGEIKKSCWLPFSPSKAVNADPKCAKISILKSCVLLKTKALWAVCDLADFVLAGGNFDSDVCLLRYS